MLKRLILCSFILALAVSFLFSDEIQLGEGEVLLEPSSKPMVLRTLNGDPSNPFGRFLDTLYYDDGTIYWIYQGTSNALWWLVRFTPAQPCTVKAGLIMVYIISGGAPVCTLFVWDDVGGSPNSSTGADGPVAIAASGYPNWDRADFTGGYYDTDDFWVGYWLPWWSPGDSARAGCDASPNYGSRQCIGVRSGGGWSWSVNPGLNGDLMIRAVVEYVEAGDPDIDCTPNPLVYNAKGYDGQLEFTHRMYSQKIAEELQEKMEHSQAGELLPVIVEFDKLIDTQFLYNLVKNLPKPSRRSMTINTLQDFTKEYQQDVMDYLESMQAEGKVDGLSQLWLTNSIGMKATKAIIEQIADHPGIALIWLDDKLTQPYGRKMEGSYDEAVQDAREIVWNVTTVNADDVWALGYTGDGAIVGHIDTGCNYNHNDLSTHMWDGGGSYPHHGWDYISNDNDPMDTDGHGTHTCGTVSSDGTAGSQCGVAPDAIMMILRGVPGTLTVLQNCVNFCLNHGAEVLTMSAGWDSAGAGGSWNSLSSQNRYMVDNCMTAGVVFCTSAGNGDGWGGHYNAPYDIGIPANVPPPWYGNAGHSACMAVGSTNQGNSYSSFSSRGPTQWWFSPWYEYQYPPGLIKPDIAAPGGSPGIKSCSYTNNNGYVSGWQGTSMSCPHVAGCVALMLEKDPTLTPEEIDSIIEMTATDLGSAGKDNYYGAGLLNCLAAVNAVGGTAPVSGTFYCHNLGDANLNVTGITWSEPWISIVAPTAFTVTPNDSQGVNVDVDTSGLSPGTYYDTLWIASNDPDEDPYGEVVILYHGTGVEESPAVKTYPTGYRVSCFPNPAKNAASLMFTLPRKGDISLDVYDATGRRISTVAKGSYEGGTHQIVWNRTDENGVRVPQGIYFVRLKAKGIEAKGKLILVN
jgi:hypothetical protein